METTLSNGQIVLVKPVGNRGIFTEFIKLFVVTFGYTTISVGDIVIAKNPSHPQENICKRVRGLEGDLIPAQYQVFHQHVPAGSVWVEGDNSTDSRDSRNFGPLPIGKEDIDQ